jgi:hypothetical protein
LYFTRGHWGEWLHPPRGGLFVFFGYDAERNASIERNRFKLDVDAIAVGVRPYAANANPVVVAAFAVANIVGKVAGRPGSDGFGFG